MVCSLIEFRHLFHFHVSQIYFFYSLFLPLNHIFIDQAPCRSWRTSPQCSYLYQQDLQPYQRTAPPFKNSFPWGSRCLNDSSWREFVYTHPAKQQAINSPPLKQARQQKCAQLLPPTSSPLLRASHSQRQPA